MPDQRRSYTRRDPGDRVIAALRRLLRISIWDSSEGLKSIPMQPSDRPPINPRV